MQPGIITSERTMIIVWSWSSGGETKDGEVWAVAGSRQASDRVVCIDHKASQAAETRLAELVEAYSAVGDIFIFLHRRHGYNQDHINRLSKINRPADRLFYCFLFGEGGDLLYLTKDPRGLLGISGTFTASRAMTQSDDELPLSAIADAQSHLLKPEHFNYIWNRYLFAFKARIFELKEDFFTALAPLLGQQGCAAGELYAFLSKPEQRLLLLRLLSFSGRLQKGSRLDEELKMLSAREARVLHFDDGCPQLATIYGVEAGEYYEQVSNAIKKNVLAKGEEVKLNDLRYQFDQLLEAIPGATYY